MKHASSFWVLVAILVVTVTLVACQSPAVVQPTAAPTQAPAIKDAGKGQETPKPQTQPAATPSATAPVTPPAAKAPEKAAPVPSSLQKVKVAQIFTSGALGPFWLARDEGIFKKYGLDIEVISINGPQPAVAALNTGAVDALLTAPSPPTLSGAAQDMDIAMVMTFSNKLAYFLVARPEIKSLQDLKGKRLAVNRIGDSDYHLAREAIAKLGLKPDDIQYLAVGSMPERLGAMVQGMVDATTLSPPTDLTATKQGMVRLADMGELGIPYVANSLHVRRSLIKEKPQVVENLVKATIEGIYVFQTNKELGIKAIGSNMKMDDKEVLDYTWDVVAKKQEKLPYPSTEGLKAVIKLASLENSKLENLPVEKVTDITFVKRIEDSGFIDNLYKGQR